MHTNPLLQNSKLAYEAIDFNAIKEQHFIPALTESIQLAHSNIEKIKAEKEANFESIIVAKETSSDRLEQIAEIFFSLYSAHCTEALSAIAEEFNEKLTQYSSDVSLDSELFAKIAAVYNKKDSLDLSPEQKTVLDNAYQDFTRNGALLNEDDKTKLREIDQQLAKLNLNFSENVRKANNAFTLYINNKDDLKGMPEGVIEAAKETAKAKKESTDETISDQQQWAFTLDFPSYLPFMQYCQNRKLRKKMWQAASTKAVSGEFDNRKNIIDTLKYRNQRAKLLGFADHPSYVLEKRMAKNPHTVINFINDLVDKSLTKAQQDFNKLQAMYKDIFAEDDFRKYDTAMISERLKKQELDFDDEALRPYFKLENVIEGVFNIASKLYGIKFIQKEDIPKYHEDVKTFVVEEKNGDYLGLFYADFFPRSEKRPGAWMTTFRNQGLQFAELKRPFVSIVCNFTKPTALKPSLLTLNEVLTLFHEFGHALHGLLAKSTYRSVAGTNVLWDFVELPSQIMENWVMEKQCLDLFAKHYQTGETIPQKLVDKIKQSQQFLEGLGTLRQMSLANLDMQWHLSNPDEIKDVQAFEEKQMQKFDFYPKEEVGNTSCSFGHIFAGGYSSAYYSYKWAEVLDADAFAYFKQQGIFNPEVAQSFKENILEKGGSEDPMQLYQRFRGKQPSTEPLLKRGGLI
ncbi:MAG: M3 family metallopeptidase [Pseudomonadota bacterium]